MYSIKLKSPFFTTNLHVRLKIVQQNIIELNVFIWSDAYKQLNYFHKNDVMLRKKKETALLHEIEKKIAEQAQLNFRFGEPLS